MVFSVCLLMIFPAVTSKFIFRYSVEDLSRNVRALVYAL